MATSFSHIICSDEDVGTNIEFNEKWADVFYEPDYVEEIGEINACEDVILMQLQKWVIMKNFEGLGFEGPENYEFFLLK